MWSLNFLQKKVKRIETKDLMSYEDKATARRPTIRELFSTPDVLSPQELRALRIRRLKFIWSVIGFGIQVNDEISDVIYWTTARWFIRGLSNYLLFAIVASPVVAWLRFHIRLYLKFKDDQDKRRMLGFVALFILIVSLFVPVALIDNLGMKIYILVA